MTHDPIKQNLNDLATQLTPGPSLVPPIMTRISQTQMHPAPNLQLRRWIMRSALGLAACLIIAFTCTLLFTQPQIAFADVIDKINQTHTLTFTDNNPHDPICFFLKSPGWERMEYTKETTAFFNQSTGKYEIKSEASPGSYTVWNKITGKSVHLNPTKHEATVSVIVDGPYDFYSWFKDFKNGKEEHAGEKNLNGKHLIGFKITHVVPNHIDGTPHNFSLILWVDHATNLPVQVEDTRGHTLYSDLHFDVPLDDSLFDMTIPSNYTITNMGGVSPLDLKSPPTTQEAADHLTLIPKVGIGPLKFGDLPSRILQILGPPEDQSNDPYHFNYPSKGLILLVAPKSGLLSITAQNKSSFGLFPANSYIGHTDKGVSLDSSRADLERAYGPPTSIQKNLTIPDMSTLQYKPLDLQVTIYKGKISQISINNN